MDKLSDEKLEWLRTHTMSTTEPEFQAVLLELQQFRAAQLASKERVRIVVRGIAEEALSDAGPERFDLIVKFIADRAAEQLGAPAVQLSEDDWYEIFAARNFVQRYDVRARDA